MILQHFRLYFSEKKCWKHTKNWTDIFGGPIKLLKTQVVSRDGRQPKTQNFNRNHILSFTSSNCGFLSRSIPHLGTVLSPAEQSSTNPIFMCKNWQPGGLTVEINHISHKKMYFSSSSIAPDDRLHHIIRNNVSVSMHKPFFVSQSHRHFHPNKLRERQEEYIWTYM